MRLDDKAIEELKQILKEDYGKEVTQAEASEIAHTLVGYFDLLAKVYHREKVKNEKKPSNGKKF